MKGKKKPIGMFFSQLPFLLTTIITGIMITNTTGSSYDSDTTEFLGLMQLESAGLYFSCVVSGDLQSSKSYQKDLGSFSSKFNHLC